MDGERAPQRQGSAFGELRRGEPLRLDPVLLGQQLAQPGVELQDLGVVGGGGGQLGVQLLLVGGELLQPALEAVGLPSGRSRLRAPRAGRWPEGAGARDPGPGPTPAPSVGRSCASPAARRARYSSTPPGSAASEPSPRSATTESQTRSTKYRSWLTTSTVPGNESSRSSSAVSVSMSRSLVGSSSSRTFGSPMSSRSSCSRRRSPPDRSPTGVHCRDAANPNRSARDDAEISWLPIRAMRATSCTASSTRSRPGSSVTCCDRYAGATVWPRTTRPASGSSSPTRSRRSVVLPAPFTPTTPIRSPG